MPNINPGPASTGNQNFSAAMGVSQASNASVIVPAGASDVAINSAVQQMALNGGGTVQLQAGTYIINAPIVPISGVSIIGIPCQLVGSALIDGQWTPSGGTILLAGNSTVGLAYNSTNLAAAVLPWATTALNNVTLKGLCFSGFQNGIIIGAVNNPGMNGCNLFDLVAYNCSQWGMIFKNFGGTYASQLWANKCVVGGIKCQHATLQQSLGNSYWQGMHIDLTQLSSPNFASGLVVGGDSTVTGALPNQFKFQNVEVFAFAGRTTVTDTAVCTSGQASFTVSNGANFPVGMPVQFTASNAFTGNVTFFVLSQSGNTLTVGRTRNGAAVNAGQTVSPTITQTGMPLLDIYNTSNSEFTGLDIEGPGIAAIYAESVSSTRINILETTLPAANVGNLTLRLSTGNTIVEAVTGFIQPDIDSQSASYTEYRGNYTALIQNAPARQLIFNVTTSAPGFNVSNKSNNGFGATGNVPDIQGTSTGTLQLATSMGQPQTSFTAGTTQAIAWYQAGITSLEVTATSQSFVLPQLIASTTQTNSTAGQPITLVNPGNQTTPQTCTIAPFGTAGTGQKIINNGTQYTTGISLPSGSTVSMVACQNSAKTVSWWQVIATTGAPVFS